jgi:AICAR transformylase/IMP cyclohydrolase PurH (only IMP cyclohydrolase domain in Aful)
MIENQFIEVLIAPDFDDASLKVLSKKPNIRALVGKEIASDQEEMKFITGVVLNQKTDNADFSNMDLKTVTEIKPSKSELEDLIFAIKVAKHVKSNAIVIAKNQMTLGIGAGQMSRVVSTKIAFMKAEEEGLDVSNCVLASDAFFPFRDNIDLAAEKGVKHIIQPGGSVKDDEVTEAADEHKISMTMTGIRHFKH